MKEFKTITLTESRFGLPEGTKISRRVSGTFAVEMPATWGYLSCGTTLSAAIRHALSGAPELTLANLALIGGAR